MTRETTIFIEMRLLIQLNMASPFRSGGWVEILAAVPVGFESSGLRLPDAYME
jgi:hypothetical protein